MNKINQNQRHEHGKQSDSNKPIPFTRRGINEDEQKRVTNIGQIENSSDYESNARQDEKAKPTREPGRKKKINSK